MASSSGGDGAVCGTACTAVVCDGVVAVGTSRFDINLVSAVVVPALQLNSGEPAAGCGVGLQRYPFGEHVIASGQHTELGPGPLVVASSGG